MSSTTSSPGATGFNPHPLRREGATTSIQDSTMLAHKVSILTLSEERVQQPGSPARHGQFQVSILTLSEERVQPPKSRRWCSLPACFNPHPLRREGATRGERPCGQGPDVSILTLSEERVQHWVACLSLCCHSGFNPHPLRREGATRRPVFWQRQRCGVSILTLSEERVQPAQPGWPRPPSRCFNPHPLRREGATSQVAALV